MKPIVTLISGLQTILLMAAATLFIAVPAQAQSQTPSEVVEVFHEALLDAMRDASDLGYDGRYKVLEPAVAATFDTLSMVRVATGRHNWKQLTDEQRLELEDAFTRLTVAAYAGRFNGYSGQFFETLGEKPSRRSRVLVETRLVKSDGGEVVLNYLMRPDGDSWTILDIYLKGSISELAVRRSEFPSVLRDKGYQGLIAVIEERIEKYKEG